MLHYIATRRTFDKRTLYWSQVNGRWCWLPHRRYVVLYQTRDAAEMRVADYRGEVVEVVVLDTRQRKRKGNDPPPAVVEPQGSAVVDEVGVFEQKALWTAEGLFV
ncbi:MAG: hypothetical protein OT477_16130 [Chloroflexi bacterium]|nr:hypothetical protein [Chloroflexota bacterium]